jgi:hypothetical protein
MFARLCSIWLTAEPFPTIDHGAALLRDICDRIAGVGPPSPPRIGAPAPGQPTFQVQRQWRCASTPVGQSAPTSSGATQFNAIGGALDGGVATGPAMQRYAGNGTANDTAATSGTCDTVAIDAQLAASGT